MKEHMFIADLTAGWVLDYSCVSDKPIIELLCDADRAITNEGYTLLRQIFTVVVKKESRSCEAAKTKEIPTMLSISQSDSDYADDFYIFSPRTDKIIDMMASYFIILVIGYFMAHIIWALVR